MERNRSHHLDMTAGSPARLGLCLITIMTMTTRTFGAGRL